MNHQFEIPARWGDMDALGHVNNVTYLDYLREARVELLSGGPHAHLLDRGLWVSSHETEYLSQAVFTGDPVVATVVVHDVSEHGLAIGYELRVRDEQILRARTRARAVDVETGIVRRFTPAEREWFESVSGTFEPLRTQHRAAIGTGPCHRYPQRIRWSDLDSSGMVNEVRLGDYFQEARVEIIWGPGSEDPDGIWLAARVDIDYLAPLPFRRDPYTVRTAVQRFGTTSMTLACDVCDEVSGTRYAAGTVVLVYGGDTGTPTRLPEAMRTRLTPWLLRE